MEKSNFLRRIFHPLLERADLPKITFRSLMHLQNLTLAATAT
jgi:hypothetical protein